MIYEVCYLSRAFELLPFYLSILSHPSGFTRVMSICRLAVRISISCCSHPAKHIDDALSLPVPPLAPVYLLVLFIIFLRLRPLYRTELLIAASDELCSRILAFHPCSGTGTSRP